MKSTTDRPTKFTVLTTTTSLTSRTVILMIAMFLLIGTTLGTNHHTNIAVRVQAIMSSEAAAYTSSLVSSPLAVAASTTTGYRRLLRQRRIRDNKGSNNNMVDGGLSQLFPSLDVASTIHNDGTSDENVNHVTTSFTTTTTSSNSGIHQDRRHLAVEWRDPTTDKLNWWVWLMIGLGSLIVVCCVCGGGIWGRQRK